MTDQKAGIIFDIARFCINDGPGIRTTIFLKGCPLCCSWCHNPEGISPNIQLSYDVKKCISCRACVPVCPYGCHSFDIYGHHIDLSNCVACGMCINACDHSVLTLIGKRITVDEVLKIALRDISYYRASSGGVTLSGGEVLFQPDFTSELLCALQNNGIHTCIETSGIGSIEALERIYNYADLVLFDFKHSDKETLQQLTGANINQVFHSMEMLSIANKPVVLRCPLIENINTNMAHIEAIAEFANRFSCIYQIDLLPYHNLGCEKSRKLLLPQSKYETPKNDELTAFIKFLQSKTDKIICCSVN